MTSKEICNKLPSDSIPISNVKDGFKIHLEFQLKNNRSHDLDSFHQYIQTIDHWKIKLIKNYRDLLKTPPLSHFIQTQQQLLIASDGSKSRFSSKGVQLIIDTLGNIIIEGINPYFGSIDCVYSQRVEMYGVLSVLLFINEYCKYYLLEQISSIKYYHDNLEVVNKISILLENANEFQGKYETTDHNAVLKIQTDLPNNLAIQ